jgi:diguanylate cyclase (GGDEF)-like protein
VSDNPARWLDPRRARVLHAATWVLLLGNAVYLASTVPGVRGHDFQLWLDGYLSNGLLFGAGALVFLRVAFVDRDRLAWSLLGASIVVYATGDLTYAVWVQYLVPIPYPSVADVLWLAFYPLAYVGIVLLVRRRVTMFHASMWLDGLVGVLGAAAVGSILVHVIVRATGGSHAAVLTTLAYPLGDLLLLVLVAGACGLFGWRASRTWALLAIGLVTYAAADIGYLLRVANDTYQPGTMLDPLWGIGYGITACAAICRPRPKEQRVRLEGWAVLVVPTLFTLSALGLLVYGSMHRLATDTVLLATACVVCGLGRTALTFREVQALADSRRQARTDELTGLGNRRRLYESLASYLDPIAPGQHVAVMLVDLDRFKEVNDSLGHLVGDELLREVGRRLSTAMRHEDELVRLGGDEFAVALRDTTEAEAVGVAERIRGELLRAFVLDGVTVHVDASIGIALAPDVDTTVSGLLQRADIAMYDAKAQRTGHAVYAATADDDLRRRLRTLGELRDAIDRGELELHYQPQASLLTGAVTGVEALVRWRHPERGLVYPDEFIPEAERNGLMRRLTSVVLGLALDQAAAWQAAGCLVPIAVNVSATNLLDVELPAQVFDMLAVRGLAASALVIEITESTLMVDATRSMAVLQRLRAGGVHISVDDYGTGYSSLAYLRDLPVDELKLDRAFTMDLGTDARAAAIVESTVRLAHSLGLPIVAEGIEDQETWDRLSAMGCDVGQGYVLSRPMPPADIEPLLPRAAVYSR